jgi:hypothetical protein
MIQIAVVNASTVLTDAEAAAMVAAVQTQIIRDWYPLWGSTAHLTFVPLGSKPAPTAWWIALLDTSDEAGALGKVFAKTTMQYGGKVSVTLSHEILEMLADPDVNLLVLKGRRYYAYEVCDAVEADALGYAINGLQVSNFVTPDYFETFRTSGVFDFLRKLSKPIPAMLPGGYLAYIENNQWRQISYRNLAQLTKTDTTPELSLAARAAHANALYRERPQEGSRRYRRSLPPATWLRSTVEAEKAVKA